MSKGTMSAAAMWFTIAAGLMTAAPITKTVESSSSNQNTTQTNGQKTTENRSAIPFQKQEVRPMMERNVHGGFGFGSDKPSRFLNQRQYRKLCRSNPCSYRSKKHRSKN